MATRTKSDTSFNLERERARTKDKTKVYMSSLGMSPGVASGAR